MDEQKVKDQLKNIFEDIFMEESIEISDSLTAEMVDAWDSLSHIDMIIKVEETFNIKIPPIKAASLNNVGELITLIKELSKS